jgi:hypothetical protein
MLSYPGYLGLGQLFIMLCIQFLYKGPIGSMRAIGKISYIVPTYTDQNQTGSKTSVVDIPVPNRNPRITFGDKTHGHTHAGET